MVERSAGARIADVAARAGVSLATVSRVMNGNRTVDPALAERVLAAAEELHYSASPLARSLVLGKTQTIAVVVPDLGNPTFQGALRGLSAGASRDGYHVLIADSSETVPEERLLAIETRRRCDGIVLCAPRMPHEELIALLPQLAPVVLINRDPSPVNAPFVAADYRHGITELLDHLANLGHERIAYLAGTTRSASNARRLQAIEEFRERRPRVTVSVLAAGVTFEAGSTAADVVLASSATAVLGFNDLVAMGLLSAFGERGVRVPEDVSVVGFDDIPFALYTTPPLTTATVPVEELGRRAWDRLADLLSGRTPEGNLMIEPRIAVRRSTAAPRSAA